MLPETLGYIEHLRQLHAELARLLEGLPAEALNWKPPVKDTNSPYVLATHIAGSEANWIHQTIGGIDVQRNRDAEFVASGDSVDALMRRLAAVAATSEGILAGLSAADLDAVRPSRHGERSVRYCILHVVEHTSRHVGQIELTKQLWEAGAR